MTRISASGSASQASAIRPDGDEAARQRLVVDEAEHPVAAAGAPGRCDMPRCAIARLMPSISSRRRSCWPWVSISSRIGRPGCSRSCRSTARACASASRDADRRVVGPGQCRSRRRSGSPSKPCAPAVPGTFAVLAATSWPFAGNSCAAKRLPVHRCPPSPRCARTRRAGACDGGGVRACSARCCRRRATAAGVDTRSGHARRRRRRGASSRLRIAHHGLLGFAAPSSVQFDRLRAARVERVDRGRAEGRRRRRRPACRSRRSASGACRRWCARPARGPASRTPRRRATVSITSGPDMREPRRVAHHDRSRRSARRCPCRRSSRWRRRSARSPGCRRRARRAPRA